MTAAPRIANRVEASLGEDRHFHAEVGPDATLMDLAKAWDAPSVELWQLVEDGWDFLLAPTVTATHDGCQCDATLTRRPA